MVTSLGILPLVWIKLTFDFPFSFLNSSHCFETCIWRISNVGRNMSKVQGGIATATLLT